VGVNDEGRSEAAAVLTVSQPHEGMRSALKSVTVPVYAGKKSQTMIRSALLPAPRRWGAVGRSRSPCRWAPSYRRG
jgi:hypothetical protein